MVQGKSISDSVKRRIIELQKQKLKRNIIKERLGVTDWVVTNTLQEYKKGK